MLDIKFIRENKEIVLEAAKNKNRTVNLEEIISLDDRRKKLQTEIDLIRTERNKLSAKMGTDAGAREEGRILKEKLKKLEDEERQVKSALDLAVLTVPNVPDKSVPIGKDSSGNVEIKKWPARIAFSKADADGGHIPKPDFEPLDHIALAKAHDLVDFERGNKVGGFRAYFLKNEAAILEFAVLFYTFQKLIKKGYTPLIAPSLVKEFTMIGSGQIPWSREEIYYLEKQDTYLSGTAEVPVTAYYSGEILLEKDLPKKFVAFSPCFRSEAGSYGKDTKGLYRLHQFNKIEQVIINKADNESSNKLHEELLKNSEEILQDLKLPYRVMLMCTGDMGEPQVKKYDIETWMPSRGAYGETMSNSFMGDFQTRRLNIRYKTKDGMTKYAHSLNNTAVASPRILIAILENYQQKDGSILIPNVLRDYVGKERISSNK